MHIRPALEMDLDPKRPLVVFHKDNALSANSGHVEDQEQYG